jgi:hypothetical protein
MRRDFRQLLTMIQSLAFLHQLQRPRTAEGWIQATTQDYQAARHLLEPVFDALAQDAITPAVRETVLAVGDQEEVSEASLAQRLQLSRSTISWRVKRALAGGWLVNRETRRGHSARLARGAALPEKVEALPTIEQLFECSSGLSDTGTPSPLTNDAPGCLTESIQSDHSDPRGREPDLECDRIGPPGMAIDQGAS